VALGILAVRGWEARSDQWWFFGSSNLLFSMPFVLVGFALAEMVRFRQAKVSVGSSGDRRALFVFTCYATMSLLWLFPAADIWHILALLPSCLPLLAWLLDRFWRGPASMGREQRVWRPLAFTLVAGLSGVLLLPALHDLVLERRVTPAFVPSLPHATRVRGGSADITTSGGRLVRFLVQEERRDDPLFVLSGKQLFYFLTERVSPVQEYEYILYMAAIDALREDHAQELIDEAALIGRLQEVRPLIVDDSYDAASQNIQRMYPRLARFVRTHYRLEAKFGKFRVLRWNSKPARP
jgi:hypothetical protein